MSQLSFDDIELQLQCCFRCRRHLPLSAFKPSWRGVRSAYCRSCEAACDRDGWRVCAYPGCLERPSRKSKYCSLKHDPRPTSRGRGLRGRIPMYGAMHYRVKMARGAARDHECAHVCGRKADHWAYDHEDPDEVSEYRHGRTMRYSLDPAHYLPLCRWCHAKFDKKPPRPALWMWRLR